MLLKNSSVVVAVGGLGNIIIGEGAPPIPLSMMLLGGFVVVVVAVDETTTLILF